MWSRGWIEKKTFDGVATARPPPRSSDAVFRVLDPASKSRPPVRSFLPRHLIQGSVSFLHLDHRRIYSPAPLRAPTLPRLYLSFIYRHLPRSREPHCQTQRERTRSALLSPSNKTLTGNSNTVVSPRDDMQAPLEASHAPLRQHCLD